MSILEMFFRYFDTKTSLDKSLSSKVSSMAKVTSNAYSDILRLRIQETKFIRNSKNKNI